MLRAPKKTKPVAPRDYRGMTGEQLVAAVREDFGPRTLLSFSRGKDSISAYLAIRDHVDVVPYYCYAIPGLLSFERESLDYFEKEVFGRPIFRYPHPSLFRKLGNFIHQPPERIPVIRGAHLDDFADMDMRSGFMAVGDIVRDVYGCKDAYVASGVRAADSPVRRLAFMSHGPLNVGQMQYYPVWDWKKDRVISEIRSAGIYLPEDYHLFGRTFDGIDLRFLMPLKKYKPEDYRRVLEWFPLADVDVWLYERGVR